MAREIDRWIGMGETERLVVIVAIRQAMRVEQAKGASAERMRDQARKIAGALTGCDTTIREVAELVDAGMGVL